MISESTRKKMSDARKGSGNSFYGKKHSLEVRKKISDAAKKRFTDPQEINKLSERAKKQFLEKGHPFTGKKHSEESKSKISIAKKGQKMNDKVRKKISLITSGEKNHFYGKKHSEETKKIISEARKKYNLENINPLKGRKFSESHRLNISKARKGKKMPPRSEETKRKISEGHRGSKSRFWKGGVTALREQIRNCYKYRQWRSDIYTRDNYTCQLCGVRGGKLQADHFIKSFSLIFHENKITSLEQALECEEFWNINNGRTLCISCHGNTDNYGCKSHKKSYAND